MKKFTIIGLLTLAVLVSQMFSFWVGINYQLERQRPAITYAKSELINRRQQLDMCKAQLVEALRVRYGKEFDQRVEKMNKHFNGGG